MFSLKANFVRFAAVGATALGFIVAGTAAQAVDIKMWTLNTEGYPEFVTSLPPNSRRPIRM